MTQVRQIAYIASIWVFWILFILWIGDHFQVPTDSPSWVLMWPAGFLVGHIAMKLYRWSTRS